MVERGSSMTSTLHNLVHYACLLAAQEAAGSTQWCAYPTGTVYDLALAETLPLALWLCGTGAIRVVTYKLPLGLWHRRY